MPIHSRRWENRKMQSRWRPVIAAGILSFSILAPARQQTASPAAQEQQAARGPEASAQTPAQESPGSAPLRVLVAKSILINTTERIKRVSVTDAAVADPIVVAPTQILVHGRSAGEVS